MCVWVLFGAVSVDTFPPRQLGWLAEKTTTKDTSWSTGRQVHTIHPPDRLCLFKLWSRGQWSIGGQIFYQVWGKSLIVHREETFSGGSWLGGEISKAASSVPDNGVRPRPKPFLLLKSLSLLFLQRVTSLLRARNISSQEKRTTAQQTIWGTTATWATITLWGDHSDMSDHGVKK